VAAGIREKRVRATRLNKMLMEGGKPLPTLSMELLDINNNFISVVFPSTLTRKAAGEKPCPGLRILSAPSGVAVEEVGSRSMNRQRPKAWLLFNCWLLLATVVGYCNVITKLNNPENKIRAVQDQPACT
jgi:hypothetical protein